MDEEKILEKAFEILKKRKLIWECKKCGYKWIGRSIGKPYRCPKCKATDWDNPKEKPIWKCYRCGYEWKAKYPDKEPRYCPNCHKREITRLENYQKQVANKLREVTIEDVRFVYKNYANMTVSEIAKKLGMSESQVNEIINQLRIRGVNIPEKREKA